MEGIIQSLQKTLGETIIPNVVGALAILIVGWLIAVVIRAIVKKSLKFIGLNSKMNLEGKNKMDLESGIASGMFYITMLVVLLGVLNVLNLEIVSAPIQALLTQVFEFAPSLVAGVVLIVVAWIFATVVKTVLIKILAVSGLDEKLSSAAGMKPMSEGLGQVCYWLTILLFLPAILGVFELGGLLAPIQSMVDKLLSVIPNIFGALIIGILGWLLAKILRDIVSNLLAALAADKLGEKVGLKGALTLSKIIGLIVYIFILIPTLIASLDALSIDVISKPATDMLNAVMSSVPNIMAGVFILFIAYFIANLVSTLITKLLEGVGFDHVPEKIGLGGLIQKNLSPSIVVGKLIVFFTMLFATVAAANLLNFGQVSKLVSTFIEFGGQVILGTTIIAIGLWLANLIHASLLRASDSYSPSIAGIVRIVILGLVFAMGLRAMGLASDIVNLAFGLTLGSVAVAVALSFGLGGREAAGKQMDYWLSKLRPKDK